MNKCRTRSIKTIPGGDHILRKVGHFYFHYNFGKGVPIFIILTAKLIRDLQMNSEFKLPPPSNLLPRYLAKGKWSAMQLYIHISENNMLHVRWYLFHSFQL